MTTIIDKDTSTNLIKTFNTIHDIIWEGGKNDPLTAFDEFVKIIYLKLSLERNNDFNFQELYNNSDKSTFESFLVNFQKNFPNQSILNNNPINLTFQSITKIFKILDDINGNTEDEDLKGRAFEYFLGKIFRDELGQYFTPRNITSFMIKFLSPEKESHILDPACGSGGFLISGYHFLKQSQSKEFNLYGIELNSKVLNAASLEFLLFNLAESNLLNTNSLLPFEKLPNLQAKKFDYIFTNPPFGAITDDKEILISFKLAKSKKAQKTEILFIERCIQFLKERGKMGIVLPDSILTNSSLGYVRSFIFEKTKVLGIISLPAHAFIPSGAGVKSSLVFLEKKSAHGIDNNYTIYIANVKNIGFDGRGDQTTDDLPSVLDEWNRYNQGDKNLSFGYIDTFSNISQKFIIKKQNFKEFSDEKWDLLTLETLIDKIYIGKTPRRVEYSSENTGFKILKVRDLTGRGIDWNISERGFVYNNFYMKNVKLKIQKDDILFITSAHHPKYIGLKVDIIDYIPDRYTEKGVLLTAELMVIRINKKKIDPYYVYLFLKSEKGYYAIQNCIRGQSAHIYPKDIKNIMIPVPKNMNYGTILDYSKKIKNNLVIKSKSDQELIDTYNLSKDYFSN